MVNTYKEDEAKTKFSWKNMGRMMEYVKPYKKDLIASLFLGIIASISLLFIPKIISYAIDSAFPEKNFLKIVLLTTLMLGIILVSLIITRIRRDKQCIVLNKVAHDLKVAIFTKLQYLPNTFYDTRSNGKIYTRATSYPDDASVIMCYILIKILFL